MSINLKLNILGAVILVFFLLSLLISYEMSRGAYLEQLNFNHVKYNNIFLENVMRYEESKLEDLNVLRQNILMIRKQPVACLNTIGTVEHLFMAVIKTDQAIDLCKKDIEDADRALRFLGGRESKTISKELFLTSLHVAIHNFNKNSDAFDPLITKTVSTLFRFIITASIALGSLALILTILIIKAIKKDYKKIETMSGEITKLASFPEKNPHPIIEINQNLEVTYANPAFKNTFPQLPLDDRFKEEVFKKALTFTEKTFKEKTALSFDYKLNEQWFNFYLTYIEFADEPVVRVFARNITLQKNTQERFEITTRGAHIGLWDWNISTNKTHFSDEWYTLLGYEPLELPEDFETFRQLCHPDDFEEAMSLLEQHLAGEIAEYQISIRMKHKKGHEVWILTTGQVTEYDELDEPVRVSGIHMDITKRKKAQKEMEETKQFQDLIMSNIPDLLFIKNKEFKIVQANPALLNLYPEDIRDSVIGTTTVEEYNKEEAEAFLEQDRIALKEGYSEIEETLQFPDGEVRTLLTKKVRFQNSEGEKFILGIARDITNIKTTEKALIEANAELEEFAYRTSHDLRSPIISSSALLSIVEKMIDEEKIEDAKSGLHHAQSSLDKLKILIDDILQLTMAKRKKEEKQNLNVTELIEEGIKKLSHLDGYNDINIQKDFGFDNMLTTQKLHLTMIFENMFSNAIKYRDPKKKKPFVKIKTAKEDGHFILKITDNGLGIPKDQQKNLFQMFKRFHPKVAFGSGLGLYLMKKSADALKGKLEFSGANNTTSFTLKIPLEQNDAP